MQSRSKSGAFKKHRSKIIIGLIVAAGLIGGSLLWANNSHMLLADMMRFDNLQALPGSIDNIKLIAPAEPTKLPPIKELASSEHLSLQKLVSVGTSSTFYDADSLSPVVTARAGDELRYLIHVGNLDDYDTDPNTPNFKQDQYVVLEDTFPTQTSSFRRQVTCWTDDQADSVAPGRFAVTYPECNYSEPSQRFFSTLSPMSPDVFTIMPLEYLHVLVTGDYIMSASADTDPSGTVCNVAIASTVTEELRDEACVQVNSSYFSPYLFPEIIYTPIGKPTIPQPIPEPETIMVTPNKVINK